MRFVSIPFKRESGSKVYTLVTKKRVSTVSIPFKRESGSKVDEITVKTGEVLFQFPSNGKADPKSVTEFERYLWLYEGFNSLQTGKRIQSQLWFSYGHLQDVSIPFKRESGSKVFDEEIDVVDRHDGFNSLQTGKRIQRIKTM